MLVELEPMLREDPQARREACRCESCGGVCYAPSGRCERCGEDCP